MDDIRWLDGGDDLHEAFAIRLEVFCDEQGYSPEMELDELDRTSRHVLLYRGDEPVATGRLYEKRPGVMGIGRLAVRRAWRGTGMGGELLDAMVKKAAQLGAQWAELDAQCRVIGFYEKQGFTVCGEEHMDGHVPHRMMRRKLE